jgi:hypothetical protein
VIAGRLGCGSPIQSLCEATWYRIASRQSAEPHPPADRPPAKTFTHQHSLTLMSRQNRRGKSNSRRTKSKSKSRPRQPSQARRQVAFNKSPAKPPRQPQPKRRQNKKKQAKQGTSSKMISAAGDAAKAYATVIALPEITPPTRFPTIETARRTALFGPMPRETRKDMGIVSTSGTPVITNGQVFAAITNNPHCSQICHTVPGGVSRYNLQNFIAGQATPTTTFTPPLSTTAAVGPFKPIQGTPDASDTTAVHDDRYICPRAAGRRGFWLGTGQPIVLVSSANANLYLNLYKWDGSDWVLQTTSAGSVAAAATVPVGITNTGPGAFYAMDLTTSAVTFVGAYLINSTYSAGAGFTNLPSGFTTGTTAATNWSQEMFTFKAVPKLSSYLGSYESARINAASLRFTCTGTAWTNGGVIDQVQLPQGESVADMLNDVNTRSGDALSILATYPGRRYEAVKKGSYGPIIPDGAAYHKFKDLVDINLGGTIQDIWWDLDKKMTIVACAASSAVPTSSVPANQVVIQTFAHMETFCTNLAFPTDFPKGTFEQLMAGIKLLTAVQTTTENPSHMLEIISEIWSKARPIMQQVGPAMMLFGAGKGAPGAAFSGAGAVLTALSQISL